jgi:uncharacterized protein YlxP (DUF503 family)
MVVGCLTIELDIPGADSLKAKRAVLNRVKSRVRNRFNAAIAEVDGHEVWNYACLGIVTVSNEERFTNEMLSKIEDFVDTIRDCEIEDSSMEFMHLS